MNSTADLSLLRRLVNDAGPRWCAASSEGNRSAAEITVRAFEEVGFRRETLFGDADPANTAVVVGTDRDGYATATASSPWVALQPFPFLGWEPVEEPKLTVLTPEVRTVPVAPMEYAGLVSPPGVVGTLRRAGEARVVPGFLEWPRYGLFDETDRLLALFVGHEGLSGWDAPPIPLHNPDPSFAYPMAMLGQSDHRRIGEELDRGVPLTARFTGGGRPAALSGYNVVARIKGTRADTVVVSAHLDTSYRSPGANNNAGGVQVLLNVARRLLEASRNGRIDGPSVEFLVCDAAEWHFLGSRHYLYRRAIDQDTTPLIANINVDSITTGNELFFVCSDDPMKRVVKDVTERLRLRDRFASVTFLGALAGSDHYSFIEAGVHATEILFWPCPTYKTPDDTMQGVDPKRISDAEEITTALIAQMEEI